MKVSPKTLNNEECITYKDVTFQHLQTIHKFIVNVYLNIMSAR